MRKPKSKLPFKITKEFKQLLDNENSILTYTTINELVGFENDEDLEYLVHAANTYPKAIEHLKFVYSILKISNEKHKEGFLEIEDFLKEIEQ